MRLERLVQRLCSRSYRACPSTASKSALHVDAVIAVADRLIERGQFRRAGDDLFGGVLDQGFERIGLECHLICTLLHHGADSSPAASK